MVSKQKIVVQLKCVLGRWVGSWAQLLMSPKSITVISWGLIAAGRRCRELRLAGVLVQHPPRAVGSEWGMGSPSSSSLPLFP